MRLPDTDPNSGLLPKRRRSAVTPARKIAYQVLVQAEANETYVDHILGEQRHGDELSAADRNLLTELVYGVMRWQGQLDWVLSQLFHGRYRRASPKLRAILRLGLYQLTHLDRVPAYAAVSESVALAKAESPAWGRLVNGVLRSFLRNPNGIRYPNLADDPVAAISTAQSHPEWLVRRWVARFGVDGTHQLCEANNRRPPVSLRVNFLRASVEEVVGELRGAGADVSPGKLPQYVRVAQIGDLQRLPLFQSGKVSVQDESAALPVLLLDPEPGETVLDLCSAPGGKSTYLAERMKDHGRVLSLELDRRRARLVHENNERLGLSSPEVIVGDARHIPVREVGKILLDVPCSGLGVLSKRADLRWKRREEQITELSLLQLELLHAAASQVTSGGIIVYSTCTIEPEENEQLVETFLASRPGFVLEPATNLVPARFVDEKGYARSFPHVHGTDGSFAARIRRTGITD
jgi:16S rRNA (cytosine967-C5)-methyltransferase